MDELRDADRHEIEIESDGVITYFYPAVNPTYHGEPDAKPAPAKPATHKGRPGPQRTGGQIVNLDGTPTGKYWNGRQGNYCSWQTFEKSTVTRVVEKVTESYQFCFDRYPREYPPSLTTKEYASPVPTWEAAGGVVTPVEEGSGVTSWRMPTPRIVYGETLRELMDRWRKFIDRNSQDPGKARLVQRYREDMDYHRARAARKPGKFRKGDAASIGGWPRGWDFEDRYLNWLLMADKDAGFLGNDYLVKSDGTWFDPDLTSEGEPRSAVHTLVGADTNFLDRAFCYELYADEAELKTFGHHRFGKLWNRVRAKLRAEAKRERKVWAAILGEDVRPKGPH